MAGQLRVYRGRIKSTQSMQKIFRAMELIATSRISRARQAVAASNPYARALTRAVSAVATFTDAEHPLITERTNVRRAAVLVVTSDRGMAGAYSAGALKEAERLIARLREQGTEAVLFVAGRKGEAFYRFRRREIHVVYTRFVNMVTQEPTALRLLPLEVVEGVEAPAESDLLPLYDFEPDVDQVLDALLPRYVSARIFNALLQAAASEHAARQRAMKSAGDNADDLIRQFTRLANQARQSEITQEISEIVSGADALADANS